MLECKDGIWFYRKKNQTHVAASQLSISSSTDHAVGDQVAPPVRPGAGGMANHRKECLLQDVSNRTSSLKREQVIQIQSRLNRSTIHSKVSRNPSFLKMKMFCKG